MRRSSAFALELVPVDRGRARRSLGVLAHLGLVDGIQRQTQTTRQKHEKQE